MRWESRATAGSCKQVGKEIQRNQTGKKDARTFVLKTGLLRDTAAPCACLRPSDDRERMYSPLASGAGIAADFRVAPL